MTRLLLFALLWITMTIAPEGAHAQRLLGTTAPYRNSVSNEVKLIPQAGMAIIYDMPTPHVRRVRVLERNGRITDVAKGELGSSMFDEFVWNEREQRLYALSYMGPLYRWDSNGRVFQKIAGRPFEFRAMRYIPWFGRLVLVGEGGLNMVENGRIVPVPLSGSLPKELYYVRDAPQFKALLLGNDKQQFLRTADGRLHFIGEGGIGTMAELNTRPAIQLAGPRVAFDIAMTRSKQGAWNPTHVERVPLAWGMSSMLRSFVPSMDAYLIDQPGFFDWLLGRSGFYRLASDGLERIGDSRQRGTKFPAHIGLRSSRLDLLRLDRGDQGGRQFWSIGANAEMRLHNQPRGVGRWFNVFEQENISFISGADGVWLWNGRETPRPVAAYEFGANYPLPLKHELLFTDGITAAVVDRSGHVTHLHSFAKGEVLQTGQDRVIVIGPKIIEFSLPMRG